MFETVVGILFPVFALAAVGFSVGKWIKPDFGPINRLNMEVFVPAIVFSSLVTMPLDSSQIPLLTASFIAVLLPGILIWPICRIANLKYKTWAPPIMFRNSGNLAIPLFTYTFGESALASAVLLFVVSACLHVSVGLLLLSEGNPFKQVVKMPVFLASLIALTLNLSGVGIWNPLYEATALLGQAAVPVMLVSLGSQMCNIQLSGLRIGLGCTLLSIAVGAISFGMIYYFVPLPTLQLQMMVLFTMLPPAVMNFMFAERFNVEPQKVASMVLFSNFFCVLTLPLLLTFALSYIK
ncbi:AEC family transporter [Vibrio sp. MA40-2]|uniref:AEC family transporter n=1 Tax=Vibrio sp. MA40-2 TaxID=3391828 RepID=UPI0039A5E4C3